MGDFDSIGGATSEAVQAQVGVALVYYRNVTKISACFRKYAKYMLLCTSVTSTKPLMDMHF